MSRSRRATPLFVFVGERRSARAIAMDVFWEDGRLTARTLHAALRAAGLDLNRQRSLNLFADDPARLALLRHWTARARPRAAVVALGRRVQRALDEAGIPHRALIHPAARGAVRRRDRYQAHVAAVLGARARGG
jgi:hypothetical protein